MNTFRQHKSVFAKWLKDSTDVLDTMFSIDIKRTKLTKFIHDPKIYQEVCDVLRLNLKRINEIHRYCIGVSSYPYISWLEFAGFCKKWLIPGKTSSWLYLDEGTCSMTVIDWQFVATNFEEVKNEQNRERYLCRFEFYEILVRIAEEKYWESGKAKSVSQALTMLLDKNLFRHSYYMLPCAKWRKDKLWSILIDDLYFANLSTLKSLYAVSAV